MAMPDYIIIKKAVKLRDNLYGWGTFFALIGICGIVAEGLSLLPLGLLAVAGGMFFVASKIKTRKRKRAEGAVYK